MSSLVKVSIITVCYNSEATISKTIQSVLEQTYSNLEYIVVDGASSDDTISIIRHYEKSFQGRMKWISEPDKGIYYAMNKGISMATGDIIGIINSDDFYEKDAVENIIQVMSNEKYQILYGFLRTIDHGREVSIALNSHEFLEKNMIFHPACFVTKDIYITYGMYNTKYISVADYDFMLRMKKNSEVHFYSVNKLIANFSTGGMCSSEKAYMDLVKLQKDYHMIKRSKYICIQCQHFLYSLRRFFQFDMY